MRPFSKILLAAAALCFLAWGALGWAGLQPLVADRGHVIVYGEGEDFYADARVYRKARNEEVLILDLPRARPAYRWWTVDLAHRAIVRSRPPRRLGSWQYTLKGDLDGVSINDPQMFRGWTWRFTATGATFSGNGFLCSVTRGTR